VAGALPALRFPWYTDSAMFEQIRDFVAQLPPWAQVLAILLCAKAILEIIEKLAGWIIFLARSGASLGRWKQQKRRGRKRIPMGFRGGTKKDAKKRSRDIREWIGDLQPAFFKKTPSIRFQNAVVYVEGFSEILFS
jgi:hypothetical protein